MHCGRGDGDLDVSMRTKLEMDVMQVETGLLNGCFCR